MSDPSTFWGWARTANTQPEYSVSKQANLGGKILGISSMGWHDQCDR